jgi:sec-independent protein translocase protein TatA
MGNLGTPEIIIIALVIMVLFGASRLPGAARGLGRALRIFKAETKGLRDDDPAAADSTPATPPPALPSGQQTSQQNPQVAPPVQHNQGTRDSS